VQEASLLNYSVDPRSLASVERLRADIWPTYVFPRCREMIMIIARPSPEAEPR
jgi:hypothetical protein